MARQIANVNIATFTFYGWVQKTNELAKLASNTVTVDVTTGGDMSTGNGFITGIFGANTLTATNIRGGNVQTLSTTDVNFISNVNFGNSSVNILTTRSNIEQTKADKYTSTSTSLQAIDEFPIADYRSGKYLISIKSGTSYQVTELVIMHDDTDTYTTEYATLTSGSTLAQFSANITSGNVKFNVIPSSATSTTYKYQRTLLAV
jgi:hypothetical protein